MSKRRIPGKVNRCIVTAGVLLNCAHILFCDVNAKEIALPSPVRNGEISLESALRKRRSVRKYKNEPLSLNVVSQLLWASQGVTGKHGFRTAPSAGALYPLEVYLVAGNVTGLPAGVYRYRAATHSLTCVTEGGGKPDLASTVFGERIVRDCAFALVFSAVYERSTVKYGERGIRYVHMEVGHAAQNVYLQVAASGLATVFIGAFSDTDVKKMLKMPEGEWPLGIMPVGVPGK